MGKHNEYFVVPRKDGTWAVELPHADRASAVESTQEKAIKVAKKFSPEGVGRILFLILFRRGAGRHGERPERLSVRGCRSGSAPTKLRGGQRPQWQWVGERAAIRETGRRKTAPL